MSTNIDVTEYQPTELTVSIVSHGHGECLKRLFADIALQDLRGRLNILLTLNLPGETFDTSSYPDISIEVIRNASPAGFGHNHNAAFAKCRTKYFLILNPDVRLRERDVLRRLIDVAREDEGDGLWAPLITNSEGAVEDSVRHNLSPMSIAKRVLRREAPISRDLSSTHNGPFFWVAGMAMLLTSGAFSRVGGFDQRFFLYCEDYDLCARLHGIGVPIRCVNQVTFIHDAQRDSHRSIKYLRLHVASLLKVWISGAYWRVVLGSFRRGAL